MKVASMFLAAAGSMLNGQQQIDRQLPFTHTETSHQMQEIATVVRSVSLVPQVNLDASGRSISLRGERGQIETAEWLLGRLDRPTAQAGEYRVSGDEKEGAVKILIAPKFETVERLQEVATILRATCDIRRMFTYNAHYAMIIRTSPEQVACGEWLLAKLLKSPEVAASPEFRLPFREGIVRVVPLKGPATGAQFQELAVLVRSMSMLRWVFTLPAAPGTLVLRGLPEQLALAEWLVAKLDLQADRQTAERHEYLAANWPGNPEVAVRVVLLPTKSNDLEEVAKAIRTRTEVRNLSTYTPLRALAFRSIPSAATAAEHLIAERHR